jgi:hypothetical protein
LEGIDQPAAAPTPVLAFELPSQKSEWQQRTLVNKTKLFREKVLDQLQEQRKHQSLYKESSPAGAPQISGKPGPVSSGSGFEANNAQTPVIDQPRVRMVHYDGSIMQRAARPEAVLDSAIRYVRSRGGELESRDNQSAALRVPVDKFRAVFDSLLTFADVIEKSISALDITESFRDNDLRIRIAKTTIERLKAILLKTEKDEEKIRLLDEIKRVSETLEGLERQRQSLADRAEFSTIRLQVVQYRPGSLRQYTVGEINGFGWIGGLTPFHPESRDVRHQLEFSVPKGMVPVKSKNYRGIKMWRLSSADGAQFWSCSRKNQPRGTTEFWFAALKERLAGEFPVADTAVAGNFKMLRLVSFDPEPYVYIVGVWAHDKNLDIVEVYFPSSKHEERYKKDILASIAGGVL